MNLTSLVYPALQSVASQEHLDRVLSNICQGSRYSRSPPTLERRSGEKLRRRSSSSKHPLSYPFSNCKIPRLRMRPLLRRMTSPIRATSVEDILQVLIVFVIELLELDFALLFLERHMLLRVLHVLAVLATSGKDSESLYKRVNIKRLSNIFKEKEYREAFDVFNDKKLINKLFELVGESEKKRMKKLEKLNRSIDSLH